MELVRWLALPVMLAVFINFGINGLPDHAWAIYAMPLTALAYTVWLALYRTRKSNEQDSKSS